MGFAQVGGFTPTARMYKLGVLLAASLTVCITLWMVSNSLNGGSTPFGGVIALPNVLGGGGSSNKNTPSHNSNNNNGNNNTPGINKDKDLRAGQLPQARVSYDLPEPGERANAAIVALVRNSELDGLRKSIRMFEDRFNRRFKYP
ncbi:hypothetical protein GGH92_011055, partial [Coemansia sp. RSA 2673]